MVKLIKVSDELHFTLNMLKLTKNFNSIGDVVESKFKDEIRRNKVRFKN